jgi:hypothetical protein
MVYVNPQRIGARLMSAMPLTAARRQTSSEVRVGPKADIAHFRFLLT